MIGDPNGSYGLIIIGADGIDCEAHFLMGHWTHEWLILALGQKHGHMMISS